MEAFTFIKICLEGQEDILYGYEYVSSAHFAFRINKTLPDFALTYATPEDFVVFPCITCGRTPKLEMS